MRKRIKLYALGAVGVAILLKVAIAATSSNVTDVRIEPVARRDLVASVTASGQVRSHTKVDISVDITGRITQLAVKEGDMVRQGQFLLQIDPSTYRAAVDRAEAGLAASKAQVAQAQANFLQAQSTYKRTAELKHRNPDLVADEQLEQLRTTMTVNQELLKSARSDAQQSVASLHDAQSALAKTTVVAPIAGKVTRLNVEQGETAIMGTLNKDAATLLTISDMSVLETQVKVDETDVSRLRVGDSAVVQLDAFPDTTFRGLVTEISSSSAPGGSSGYGTNTDQAVDYTVTVRLLNAPANTRPDFSATAKIITATRSRVLTIPIVALTVRDQPENNDTGSSQGRTASAKGISQKDDEGVFVVGKDHRVTFRPVHVGVAGERYFEVLSGLKEGEQIIGGTYQAIRTLKDGTKVRASHNDAPSDSAGS